MMMGTIENPKISIEDLNNMEKRIKENTATSIDYKKLDDYLSFLGIKNYIITKLHSSKIDDYQDFIYQRTNKNSSELNKLVGSVLGVISYIKNHILGKL